MTIFVAGLSYKTAPVELRERLVVLPSRRQCHGCRLKINGDLSEVVLLSTCNRVEIYGVTPSLNGNLNSLFRCLSDSQLDFRYHMYVHEGANALRHLFRVSAGLDSMVLGETEITGQVKQAYETAHAGGLTGGVLNRVFQKAMQTAKEIRTRTNIGRGATSVGSVAVELAEKIFGDQLARQTVIIIGAGQMGETCVRHLAKKGAQSVLVANRNLERAQQLAAEFGGQAMHFDDCLTAMANADIVVASTGCPKTLLHKPEIEKLMQARRQRPLFLIDIAVPRNIAADVQDIDNVYLYNIDDLEALVRENVRLREQDLALCSQIIEQKTETLMAKLFSPRETPHDLGIQPQPGWLLHRAAACGS